MAEHDVSERRSADDGIRLDGDRLHVADRSCAVDHTDAEAVLGGYVALLSELRHCRPGDTVNLRAEDLAALAGALGSDSADVERRIIAIVGCTRDEATRLARELRRRRLLRPVAVAALGLAVVTGVQAEHDDGSEPHVVLVEPAAAATVDADPAEASPTPTTTPPPAPEPSAEVQQPAAAPEPPADTAPAPVATDAPAAPIAPSPPAPPAPPAPVARTDAQDRGEPDVGIPEGEVFVEADPVTGEPLGP